MSLCATCNPTYPPNPPISILASLPPQNFIPACYLLLLTHILTRTLLTCILLLPLIYRLLSFKPFFLLLLLFSLLIFCLFMPFQLSYSSRTQHGEELEGKIRVLREEIEAMLHNAIHHQRWDTERQEGWFWFKFEVVMNEMSIFSDRIKNLVLNQDRRQRDREKKLKLVFPGREKGKGEWEWMDDRGWDEIGYEDLRRRSWVFWIKRWWGRWREKRGKKREERLRFRDDHEREELKKGRLVLVPVLDELRGLIAVRKSFFRFQAQVLYRGTSRESGRWGERERRVPAGRTGCLSLFRSIFVPSS